MIASPKFSQHIIDALFDPSPELSIDRVKTAVAQQLEALDPTAVIKSTQYFNHTFAPDFLMSWGNMGDRPVFLRLAYNVEALTEDVELIDSIAPFILGLNSEGSIQAKSRVDTVIADTNAMFIEPEAMENLVLLKGKEPTADMLSNAMAQGGRGSFVADDTIVLSEKVKQGFESAAVAHKKETFDALKVIEKHLGGTQASRMTRVMQAVWEGSGGSLEEFPGEADLSGRLTIDSLNYLIKYVNTDDKDFWRRVGRKLQLSDLEGLDFKNHGKNAQRLINANLDILQARAAILRNDPMNIGSLDEESGYAWGLSESRLMLRAPQFFAVVGSAKKDLKIGDATEVAPVSVQKFIERSQGFDLVEVTMQSGLEQITSKIDQGVISADRLTRLEKSVDKSGEIVSAIVETPSGRVQANLTAQTGTGITRSNLLLADLLVTTAPLVVDLPPGAQESLKEFLAYENDAFQEQLEFDDLVIEEVEGIPTDGPPL